MTTNVNLEKLASDYVKTAYISNWKVEVGDKVSTGDTLLEVETAKVTVEIESPVDGFVLEILFPEDSDVDITETVAIIGDEKPSNDQLETEQIDTPEVPAPDTSINKTIFTPKKVLITPVAKKVAEANGVNLDTLFDVMGNKGVKKVKKRDVLSFMEEQPPKQPSSSARENSVTKETLSGMRRTIAKNMKESKQEKPHVTLMLDVQVDELFKVKKGLEKRYPDEPFSVTGLITVAVNKSLQENEEFNGTLDDENIYLSQHVNIGIAVDVPDGLIVPVIKNCENLNGREICSEVKSIAEGAINGELSPDNYTGGTFTITNIGTMGVKYFTPIINKPEIAILGVGSVQNEIYIKDNEVHERRMMGLSLSFDHSAVDGAPAAKFLNSIKDNIENMYLLGF